jgi:hypothetical protein
MDISIVSSLNYWTVLLALWIPLAGCTLAVLWDDEAEG